MNGRPTLRLAVVVFATDAGRDAAEVLRGHGGVVLKQSEGRWIARFDGLTAALDAGRELAAAGSAVGVAAGDVAVGDGDIHGLSVVLAARLCGAAGDGQVLVPRDVAGLEGAGGTTVGDLELKGIPGPVPTVDCA